MFRSYVLPRLFMMLFLAVLFTLLLVSCATNSNQISINTPTTQQTVQSSSKPPPYESYPGEAAQVKNVLDSMDVHPHNAAPLSGPSSTPSSYPRETGYPVTLTVNNETSCQLGFYLQGPSARTFGIKGGSKESVEVAAGSYKFGVDTHLCLGKLPPLMGNEVFEAGGSYTLTLSEQAMQANRTPTTGKFEICNDTGAALMVKVGGVHRTVAGGTSSISLPVGSYTAAIKARCGSTEELFEITQGETYSGRYWCEGGKVSTSGSAESSRSQSGSGEFVVHNATGGTLAIKVGSTSRSVGRGTSSISLPEGNYKASIISRCGSATESLSIEAGSQYEGHYKCVSYRAR